MPEKVITTKTPYQNRYHLSDNYNVSVREMLTLKARPTIPTNLDFAITLTRARSSHQSGSSIEINLLCTRQSFVGSHDCNQGLLIPLMYHPVIGAKWTFPKYLSWRTVYKSSLTRAPELQTNRAS